MRLLLILLLLLLKFLCVEEEGDIFFVVGVEGRGRGVGEDGERAFFWVVI